MSTDTPAAPIDPEEWADDDDEEEEIHARDLWAIARFLGPFASPYRGGFLLLGGRAADLLGRRRILMVGLGLFSAASLAAALATGAGFMIGARAVQGIGGAIMLPAALSIVMTMFQEGAGRNKALGIWGGLGAGGATVGVIAGGLLTRYVGWQYIFYLNVPIGAVALLLAIALLFAAIWLAGEARCRRPRCVDENRKGEGGVSQVGSR